MDRNDVVVLKRKRSDVPPAAFRKRDHKTSTTTFCFADSRQLWQV